MGAVLSQIFLQHVHFWPFYVYHVVHCPTTSPIWQMFQILLCILIILYIYERYLGVETMVQFLSLMLWQCLCSGDKNKVCIIIRDHDQRVPAQPCFFGTRAIPRNMKMGMY
jgi:hypothetical protein